MKEKPGSLEPTKKQSALPLCEISLVIPVLNEEEGLDECFKQVTKVLESSEFSYEIVFVDDGSTDNSLNILISLCKKNDFVKVIQLKKNYGQQKALFAGLENSSGKVIITYDADLQCVPDCLPVLARKVLEGYNIVSGVRKNRKDPFWGRTFSAGGNWLINKALNMEQKDFGAVKAFDRELVKEIIKQFEDSIYGTAYSLSKNFSEVYVDHELRLTGKSKWSILTRVEAYFDIYTAYSKRPFEWVLVGGAASFALAILVGLGIVFYSIAYPFEGIRETIIFFDLFLAFSGLNFIVLSLIGEFVLRLFRKHQTHREDIFFTMHSNIDNQ